MKHHCIEELDLTLIENLKEEDDKMSYYILYPKNQNDKVSIRTKRPDPRTAKKKYGFAEGPFQTKKEVIRRLNWMNIDFSRRSSTFMVIK